MAYYSLVLVAHDELGKLGKDLDLGKKLENAILEFSTRGGHGLVEVHHSTSVMKVVSSFNANISPRVIVAEGWFCYDLNRQSLPEYLEKYTKGLVNG